MKKFNVDEFLDKLALTMAALVFTALCITIVIACMRVAFQ